MSTAIHRNLIDKPAPTFELECILGSSINLIGWDALENANVFIFTYPHNFHKPSTAFLLDLNSKLNIFNRLNFIVLAINNESIESHHSWLNHEVYGLGANINIPLISDPKGKLLKPCKAIYSHGILKPMGYFMNCEKTIKQVFKFSLEDKNLMNYIYKEMNRDCYKSRVVPS